MFIAFTRRTLAGLAFAVLLPAATALSMSDAAAPSRIAIKGYDPVAYFTEGRPVKGSNEFEYVWEGSRWHFASAANRDRFMADPDRYAPQYGGHCAMGVAIGVKAEVDPYAWTIVDSRLYLNFDLNSRTAWRQDPASHIQKGDENWKKLAAQ